MNLPNVKELIRQNSVFECVDDASGRVQVPIGDFHDVEFGGSAVFDEGDGPHDPGIQTQDQPLDSQRFRLYGRSDLEIAEGYLRGFYKCLFRVAVNQPNKLIEKSLGTAASIEDMFGALPSRCTSDVSLISTVLDFSSLLSVPYGSPTLGILHGNGSKSFVRDLLGWEEPLVRLPGPVSERVKRVIAAELGAVVLNLPQAVTPLGNDYYRADVQYKLIYPQYVLVHEIA